MSTVHVVEARVVDVASGSVLSSTGDGPRGREARGAARQAAAHDLVHLEVTQVCHGPAQLSLTMNNHAVTSRGAATPPWRYNDFAALRFGQLVQVDVRYGAAEPRWIPLIRAVLGDLRFSFPQEGQPEVTVTGEDLLGILKTTEATHQDHPYAGMDEIAIIEDCLRRAGTELQLARRAGEERPLFGLPLRGERHLKSQTFYDFMVGLAERIDRELFVDFDDRRDPRSAVRVHLEPARSLHLGEYVELVWGRNLFSFEPTFRFADVYTAVAARGEHPERRGRIAVIANSVRDELHAHGETQLVDAVEARGRFGGAFGRKNTYSIAVTGLDEARARARATRVLRDKARTFLTGEAHTVGHPLLRPGIHARVDGFAAPFDGFHYVTAVKHTWGEGYQATVSLRRPGMLAPSGRSASSGGST